MKTSFNAENTVCCTMCGWEGSEEELEPFFDIPGDSETRALGCPECKTDSCLMDLNMETP